MQISYKYLPLFVVPNHTQIHGERRDSGSGVGKVPHGEREFWRGGRRRVPHPCGRRAVAGVVSPEFVSTAPIAVDLDLER